MKITTTQPKIYLLLAIGGYLLLPCLYTFLLFSTWLPYHLAGPRFLNWYLVHMLCSYVLLYGSRNNNRAYSQLVLIFTGISVVITITRIAQGISHHRPVLYLCLLGLLHAGILLFAYRYRKV
jgi:hypothetical protein